MKKLLVVAMMLVAMMSFAQDKKFGLDVAGEFAMPMGDAADVAGMGFGATVKGYYPINEQMDVTGKTGYLYFLIHEDKDDDGFDSFNYYQIPFMVGGRYKVTPEFYGMVELGMTMIGWTIDPEVPARGLESDSEMDFTFGLGAGYIMNQFDFSAYYNSIQTDGDSFDHFGLRVGYKFM
ncbi:MAG TPA: outer membrane beta-barrel protein [Clostridiales bacterium]|nr:outer membrane beta-barrel protein [Clostridiales bacterium]